MSVYVDRLRGWGWHLGPSCHLIADTEDELHAFAGRLGLKRGWLQRDRWDAPHYDLTAKRREAAVRAGAVELVDEEFIITLRAIRSRIPPAPTPAPTGLFDEEGV